MSLSDRYKKLRKRIYALKRAMLPARFDPTGTYREAVHDRALGFRVLACAEMEAFFEDRVQSAVRQAARNWNDSRVASKVLTAVNAFVHVGTETPPVEYNTKDNLKKRVNLSIARFEHRLKDNHGIRRHHTVPLLSMVGIEEDEIDELWISNLDNFAQLRGQTAHTSRYDRVNVRIDPKTEWNSVIQLVESAKQFDKRISDLGGI